MSDEQSRIVDDLAGLLEGELRCDPLTVAMYASDASLYQIAPLGVFFPRHRDDLVTVARYCAEMHIPLVARGAGTGVAGESLGRGLLVDFSRHMRRIEAIQSETIRVQPGMVCDRLNRVLRPLGRYFPPDPAGFGVTTIGSMLALDATGSHSVRVGSTRDHVRSLDVVLAGGEVIEAGDEPLELLTAPLQPRDGKSDPNLKRTLVGKLADLLREHATLIQERQPVGLRNRCGYGLRGVLTDTHLHLGRMLVGSEGTLGLFTSALLHTAPLPAHRGVALLLFSELEAATRAVLAIAPQQPSACDLLDRRLLSLAREADSRFDELIPAAAEAALIVEQVGLSDQQVRDRIQGVVRTIRGLPGVSVVSHEAYDPEDVEFLWSLPQIVVPLLTRLQGKTRPLPFVEDIAVPPALLHEFLLRAQNVFQKYQITASLYSHAAAGQIHLRPFMTPPLEKDAHLLESIARDLYQVVFSLGGTISGEHGAGLSRTAFIRSQYGPLYRVFREIKEMFDPENLLNPGKIISVDPHLTVKDLRPPAVPVAEVVDLQLRWTPDVLAQAASRCNGCGTCRTQGPESRMCPLFRIDPHEEASPRAKANLIRNFTAGLLKPDDFASPEMKRVANLCFNCKQCELECPSNVNIPQMMIEAKAAYVAAHGLSRPDWILSRAHSFGALGSLFPRISNRVLESPTARWLVEKLLGIARQRKLPQFASRTFMRYARRELLTRPVRQGTQPFVVYFVDHYANFHDPQLGRALVAVLRHHGIAVHVPPDQMASGMAMLSAGDLDAAREHALGNIRVLAEFAREGVPIVCTEPAAALCLKYEYPMLVDHPDVQVVADRTIEAGAFLAELQQQGKLHTDFQPLPLVAGYHMPCHLRALGAGTPLRQILNLIPQLQVHTIEKGCSGMAGAYGLTRENFRNSMRVGWGLISRMRQPDLKLGVTECSSCKMQMEQGSSTPTLHPLKLLALSYGLMPELAQKLKPSLKRLIVT